jgi:hypothetical protein
MGKGKLMVLAGAIVASLVLVGTVWADEGTDQPIPDQRQTRLLEKFGAEGIDANGDGTLTYDEVHAFLADKHPAGWRGKWNRGEHFGAEGWGHHGKGRGHHGMGDRWLDENGTINARRQERLLEKFGDQGIDADGNGTLTVDEVDAFFAENRPQGKRGACDGQGPHGKGGMRGRRGPCFGPEMGPPHLGMMLRGLDLTAEQQAEVEAILDKLHEDVRTLHQAAHDEIKALLTEEQAAKLKEWRPEPASEPVPEPESEVE